MRIENSQLKKLAVCLAITMFPCLPGVFMSTASAAGVFTFAELTSPSQLDGSGTIIFAGNNGVSQGTVPVTVAASGGNIEFRPDSELASIIATDGNGTLANGGLAPPTITDENLKKVVYDLDFNNTGGITGTIPGLTVGLASRLQLMYTTFSQADRTFRITVEGESIDTLASGTILATYDWIAEDTTLDLSIVKLSGNGAVVLSGFVVSQVPEPTSAVLLIPAFMGLARLRRRRR